ncbi:MAG: zinc dependent phospholipase C family protein [Anaerolineaceae bacterium]
MPTPFYHLSIAQNLLDKDTLSPEVQQILKRQRGAFLFGNTAADVQVLSGQERQETHFFSLPILNNPVVPWQLMLNTYPDLEYHHRVADTQAAFIAGYLCHLLADWRWIVDIFVPAFGLKAEWGDFSQRLYYHNVLRAYLDRQTIAGLPDDAGEKLGEVKPDSWLPFVNDQYLYAWRDYLAEQLQPGANVHTIDVFAKRQGVSPQEYTALLGSEERMENEIFTHLSRQTLTCYRQQIEEESKALVNAYFSGEFVNRDIDENLSLTRFQGEER